MEQPDSDVTALTGNIFATLTGSYSSNPVSETITGKDFMEKQTCFLGIPSTAWGVMGILAMLTGMIALCALVALMFGLDIGGVIS